MIKTTKIVAEANSVTHGGVFHADDVMASVILNKIKDVSICRMFKVPEDLNSETIVFDIGFGKFDHHQKGGNGTRENGVPYAACGLIWKEFGHEIVADTCNPELVWNMIDRDLIQGIDAVDIGEMPQPDYPAQAMSLSKIISGFNPTWDSNEDSDEAFVKAANFAEIVFDNTFATAVSKAKAKEAIDAAVEKSEEHVMVLDKFLPWQEFIFTSANPKAEEIWFVVFPSNRGEYKWQCVPDKLGGTGQRKSVPHEWRGLSASSLQAVTGVKTAIFCHNAGFIGAAETFEDAYALAKLASK